MSSPPPQAGPDQYSPGPHAPGLGPGAPGQLAAGPPGRAGLLVSAVLLGVLAVAAVGMALVLRHAATECSSDIGQIAQAFDEQAAGDCSAAGTARTMLEIAAPVLALGSIALIIGSRRR